MPLELPFDLMGVVVSFLPIVEHYRSLKLVSKLWCNAAQVYLKRITVVDLVSFFECFDF